MESKVRESKVRESKGGESKGREREGGRSRLREGGERAPAQGEIMAVGRGLAGRRGGRR